MMIRRLLYAALALAVAAPLHAQTPDRPAASLAEYIVRAGDQLDIRVWPDAELSGEFLVEPSGYVYLPVIGEFFAAGLTLSELQSDLRSLYGQTLQTPVVSIMPRFPVTLVGGVAGRGVQRVTPTQTAMDVILGAGGFTERAKRDEIRLLRGDQVLTFDAETYLEEGGRLDAPALRSGDVIVVPEGRGLSFQTVISVVQFAATLVVIGRVFTQ